MINNFEENKTALLEEFKSLSTFKKKLDFWEDKLGMNYLTFLEDFNNQDNLHEFQIIDGFDKSVDSRPYWKPFNEWILKNFNYNNPKDKNYYFNLSTLKKQFGEELKLTKNKFEAINKEIKAVDESFRMAHSGFNISPLSSGVMWNFKFNADYKTYTDFLTYGLSPDYSEIIPGLHVIQIANGKTLAEYKIYLTALLQKYPVNSVHIIEDKPLTSKQIALLIYYTDLINPNIDNTIHAKVFSGLLDINFKNLYDHLRGHFNWKSSENLDAVLAFMNKNNLKPPKELLSDIEKAN